MNLGTGQFVGVVFLLGVGNCLFRPGLGVLGPLDINLARELGTTSYDGCLFTVEVNEAPVDGNNGVFPLTIVL